MTALINAVRYGTLDECRLILESENYHPESMDFEGKNIFDYLIKRNDNLVLLELLLEHGISPKMMVATHRVPLLYYYINNLSYDHIHVLLKYGASPNDLIYDNGSLLNRAAHVGNQQIVDILLKYGADPNLQDRLGDTSLHNSIYFNNIECAQLLLQYDCDVSIKNNRGLTAKELAQLYNSHCIIQLIERYEEIPIKEPVIK
jgi:ankyrin repeat protein